jgi:acyl-CoA thioester hydrolase
MVNNPALNKAPATETVIRFQDCDPFGHLNNARYLDYFINAREDHLAHHYGLDIFQRQKRLNQTWVVAKTSIAYVRPAVVMERVNICTSLRHYSRTRLLMEGMMKGIGNKAVLKALVWIDFRHIDLGKNRPADHPQDLMALFKAIAVADGQGDFDTRVKSVCKSLTEPAGAF